MEHVMKRFLSMLIAVVMVVSMLPTSAFASTEETTSAEPTQTVTDGQPTDATEAVESTETTEAATQPTEAPVAPVALDHQPEDCPNGGHCAGCCDGNHDPAEWTELTTSTPIEDGGKYYLTCDISMQIELGANKGITVCLNGHTITAPAGQRAFWLSARGASLTIYDCSKVDENGVSKGGIVGADNRTNSDYVYGGAAIAMSKGVTTVHFYNGTISGGNFKKGGGNVGLASGSVFNMYGGLITGGVSGENGGNVFVYNSTFNMYSGTIQNGHAQNGGGVYVTNGTFNMYGGTIKNCSATVTGGGISIKSNGSVNLIVDTKNTVPGAAAPLIDNCTATAGSKGRGGNVYINSGTFTMDHGTLQNGQNLQYGGGNVFMEKSGTFTMNDGTIKDGTGAGNGGNIRFTAGTFTMNGGTISGGTCKGHGGSISVGNAETSLVLNGGTITAGKGSDETESNTIDCNGLLTINGTKITGDVRVYGGKTITVGEKGLGADSKVTLMSDTTGDSVVMTSKIATAEAAATFKSMVSSKDTETYCVSIADDYQICLIKHAYEGKITTEATCDAEGVKTFTCSNCEASYTEPIEALGHDWDEGKVTTEPDCDDAGVKTLTCQRDSNHTKEVAVDALGHSIQPVKEVAPTVTAEGYKAHFKCVTCGTLFSDAEGENEIEAPVAIPKLLVDAIIPGDVENKEAVTTIMNSSTKLHEVINLPEDHYLEIKVSASVVTGGVVTKVTYNVTPYSEGVAVNKLTGKITFHLPVDKNVTKQVAAVFHGDELMGADFEIKIDANGEKYVEVESDTFSLYTVDTEYEEPAVTYVAQIGDTKYESLEAAFAAAVEGDTIVLLTDAAPVLTSQRKITKAAVVDLGNNTMTLTEDDLYFGTTTFKNGTIVVDPSVKPSTAVFWMFADQTLTFDNVKLVATGVTGTYLIGLDGNNADLNIINGSEIVVENETALDLDIICVNASTGNDILVSDSKVTVTNLDGRVFFRGNYTISGNSDIDLTGITKAGFRIEAGQTLTIEDTATVDIVGEPRDGGIHLTDATATYTKADTATVNATINKPITAVAEVDGTEYETLQAAIDAADGKTVTLLRDVTLTDTLNVAAGTTVTLDLNGKTVSMVHAENITANHEMICNKGDLTIQDTAGNGKLSYQYTGANVGTSYAANTITTEPGSKLTVKSGTIENLTYDSSIIAYAIDGRTNGGMGDVSVTIEGGTITSARQSVRIFANSTTNTGTLTIKGGDITGRVIVQNANANANKAALEITGGTFNANAYKTEVLYVGGSNGATIAMEPVVSGGTFNGDVTSPLTGFITGGTFGTDVSDFCADGFEAVYDEATGTYGIAEAGLEGTGTEADPFQINDLDDLKLFRDTVNAGTTYDNQYVVLKADIDLAGESWTPIGNATTKFLGTFDGQDHTISNLNVSVDTNNAGLFGFASVIKNLKINNATVSGVICVGALVGELESSVGTVDNCHVTGTIKITGENSVGGLAGKGYANIRNSSVTGNADSFVLGVYGNTEEGDNVGGIIGHLGEGNTLGLTNCTAKNITVKGTRKIGGIVGTIARANDIVGCAVEGVTVESTATVDYANNNAETTTIGGIVGNYFGTAVTGGVLKDCSVKDLTLVIGNAKSAGAFVGGDRQNNGGAPVGVDTVSGNTATGVSGASNLYFMVAKVGDQGYTSLQAAVDAAGAGDTITLLDDIALAEGVVIAADDEIVLELNGKTLSRDTDKTVSTAAITNNGKLTIQDSVGGGKITAFAQNPDTAGIPYYANNTITNCGVLTVKSGTIENSTSDAARAAYPIDNNSTSRDAIVYIEGGTVIGRGAIRQFANSTTKKNEVHITGGEVSGSSYGVWVQNPGSGDPLAELNIEGGTVGKVLLSPSANFAPSISGGTVSEVAIWAADTANPERNPSGFITGGTFGTDVSDFCADGLEAVYDEATGTYGIAEAGLEGTGTEADPFLINDLDDLKLFRDMVNTYTSDGSNQFKGKFVKLTADIDLAGINWTPIGTNSVGDHAAFLGTFDGDGHTISNLYINADGDHLGFFARVGSYAEDVTPTVKNLKFHNVDVSANVTYHWTTNHGDYVGGVIANAGGNSVISNITVTGDVYIVGCGYVGGIVGHGYPDIDNCHVNAEDGSYLHCGYWCGGGIIGYAGEGGTPITNCSVSGLDIWTAYGAGGGIAGLLQDGNKVDNVTVSNVEITSDSDYCMGYVAGNGECSIMTNITVENVTATAKGNTITSTDAVASVDGAVYFDLQAAVNAAEGKTVTLLRDVALADTLKIAAGTAVTLDLNGKTISQTKACTASYEMVSNNGTLTIDDSVGGGKISFTDTGAGDPNAGWGVYTIRNAGTLVVNAGTIENLSAQNQAGQAFAHTALAIFQYSGSTTINGGVISTPNYRSVRLWSGDMTIKGGKFSGQVWVQCVNDTSKLTIEGGEFAPCWNDASSVFVNNNYNNKAYVAELSVTGGSFATKIGANDATTLNGSLICGGTFTEAAKNGTNSALIAEGFVFEQNADGSYGVEKAPVAQIGETYYETFAEAIAAANGGEVKVLCDVSENLPAIENVILTTEVAGGVTITNTATNDEWIDFNNVTIGSGVTLFTENVLISEGTNIIEGTLLAGSVTNDTTFYQCYDATTIVRNGGKVVVSGQLVHRYNETADAGIYIYGDGDNSTVEFSVGTTLGTYSGTFYAENAVVEANMFWIDYQKNNSQEADKYSQSKPVFVNSVLNVASELRLYKDATLTLTDSTVTAGKVQVRENATPVVTMTNSTITAPAVESLDGAMLLAVKDANNNVTFGKAVAKVGNKTYTSLAEAIAVAGNGDTVQLLPGTITEYVAPWANDPTHASEKSITLVGAENFGTVLTGGLYLGYDDSQNRGHTITVKGIAFEGKGILVAGQDTVIIEGNKFTNITETVNGKTSSATANAISVIGKNVNAVIKNNEIDTTVSGGINLRNTATVLVEGNTVTNTWDNSITVQGNTAEGTVVIRDNTLSDWGTSGVEGRAVRVKGGNATISGNVMTNDAAPEQFVKTTETTSLEVPANYWNGVSPMTDGMFSCDVSADPALILSSYYTDAGKANLVEISASVAKIGNAYFATLQDAINAAQNGETVTLLADVALTAGVKIPANKDVTLDLNGKTISGVNNTNQGNLIYIENTGKLTVKDSAGNGKITYASGSSNVGFAVDVKGEFVLESGTIELTGSWSIGYAVDVRPNSWGTAYTAATTFVMNGGSVISSDGAVRVASSSASAHTNVSAAFTMNGGKIDAAWDGVFVQQSDSVYDVLSFTMNGGTIESDLNPVRVYGPAATDYVNGADCMNIVLNDGTMTYTGTETYTWIIDGVLRAGGGSSIETILESGELTVSAAVAQSSELPEGYKWEENADGKFVAVAKDYVAQVGNQKFETVQAALQYAIDNGASELKILSDVREQMATDFDLVIKADLTITADAPVKVEFFNNGTSYDFAVGSTNDNKLTIAENVHFDLTDRVIWLGYYGNNVDVIVEGYLGGYQIWHGADTTVTATGTLDSHGEAFIMRRNATLTVEGGEVNANYFHIYSGHIVAEDATITAGLVWIYNNHSYGSEGTGSIDLDNTSFVSRGEVKIYAGEGKTVPVTLTNGSALTAAGALTLGEGASVKADATSSFTAKGESIFVAEAGGWKYTSLAAAIAAANGGTVKVLCDVSENLPAIENVILTTEVAGGVTITNTATNDEWIDFNNVTIGSGVTLFTENVLISEGTNIIEGTLLAGSVTNDTTFYQCYDATTIVRNGGKVVVSGQLVHRYNETADAGIYIYGDGDNSTVEFSVGTTLGTYSGTFYAEEAVVTAKEMWLDYKKDSSEEADKYAPINAEFVNATVTLTTDLRLYKDAHLTLTDSTVTAGKVQVRLDATPTVTMTGSTITAPVVESLDGAMLIAVKDANNNVTFGKAVAKVGNKTYTSLAEAIAAAGNGATVTLLDDVALTATVVIEKAITLDLNGKKVTSTAKKAFEVYADATICNGTIEGANRCVDTRKAVELTLSDLTLIADKYTSFGNPQPLTIGGSENGTKVTMTNVDISAQAGYGIITFVDTDLTATDSTISGYNALYVKPGSEGSSFNFVNSDLIGSTGTNDVAGNSFSTIAVRADNVTVNTDADTTVSADGNYCCIISLGGASGEGITGANVTVAGTINGNILYAKKLDGNTVTVKADYADELTAEGFVVENAATAGMINVAAKGEASYNGVNYASLSKALMDAYSAGGKVTLLTACELTDMIASVPAGVTLDLNGNTLKVNNIWAIGQIVDGTAGNDGVLIANGNVILDENNAFMPLYDAAAGGYRFFKYQVVNLGAWRVPGVRYYYRVLFDNAEGYDLLASGTSKTELVVDVDWDGKPVEKKVTYTYTADTITKFIAAFKQDPQNALFLNISGLDSLAANAQIRTTIRFVSETGVKGASEVKAIAATQNAGE